MMFIVFLFLGIVSALAGIYIGEVATPFIAMSEVLVPLLIWSVLLFLTLLYKNPKAMAISTPVLLLILFVNFYPLFAGSPLFSGTPLVYLTVLFSPIGIPVFPLILLLSLFKVKNDDARLALKTVSISFIALSVVTFILLVLPVVQESTEPMQAYIINRGDSSYDVRIIVTDSGEEIFNRSYLVGSGESLTSDPITDKIGTYYVTAEVNGERVTKKAEVRECRCKTVVRVEVVEAEEGIRLNVETHLVMWD